MLKEGDEGSADPHDLMRRDVHIINVIGGGDWAPDRIVPDCARALSAGTPVEVRNPDAVRPWQHVLEPTSGYLWLASRLLAEAHDFEGAWNFGPLASGHLTVAEVVEAFLGEWGDGSWNRPAPGVPGVHEARFLKLDISKAVDLLGWRPVWTAPCAIKSTAQWYRDYYSGAATAEELVSECIAMYVSAAREARCAWTGEPA